MEITFCRRCGQSLTRQHDHVYKCTGGHIIYANASPATQIVLIDELDRALIVTRKFDPGKGKLDLPGGFCDGAETLEHAIEREISEELGLHPDAYEAPQYLISSLDDYDYMDESVPVLTGSFWSKIKPNAIIKVGDDVDQFSWLSYDTIDQTKIHFKSQVLIIDKLHAMGILK